VLVGRRIGAPRRRTRGTRASGGAGSGSGKSKKRELPNKPSRIVPNAADAGNAPCGRPFTGTSKRQAVDLGSVLAFFKRRHVPSCHGVESQRRHRHRHGDRDTNTPTYSPADCRPSLSTAPVYWHDCNEPLHYSSVLSTSRAPLRSAPPSASAAK
jgi:hypothetical protein